MYTTGGNLLTLSFVIQNHETEKKTIKHIIDTLAQQGFEPKYRPEDLQTIVAKYSPNNPAVQLNYHYVASEELAVVVSVYKLSDTLTKLNLVFDKISEAYFSLLGNLLQKLYQAFDFVIGTMAPVYECLDLFETQAVFPHHSYCVENLDLQSIRQKIIENYLAVIANKKYIKDSDTATEPSLKATSFI